MEQVLVADPALYGVPGPLTPRWPPEPCVRAIHWWGGVADKLVLARPMWFQVAIWIEVRHARAPVASLAIMNPTDNRLRLPTLRLRGLLMYVDLCGDWCRAPQVFVQAPFYMLAIVAFLRRANWIRIPAIVYSTVLLTIMPSMRQNISGPIPFPSVPRRALPD